MLKKARELRREIKIKNATSYNCNIIAENYSKTRVHSSWDHVPWMTSGVNSFKDIQAENIYIQHLKSI